MSTEHTDHAQRCDRCQRITLGVRQVRWQIDSGISEHVALGWKLCRRCRTDVTELLRESIRQPVAW